MDLMSSCNLLNYWGKVEKVDEIENYPILLQKGVDWNQPILPREQFCAL